MQQQFNELVKQDVKPFLARQGFAKKGLNFTRAAAAGGLVNIIQFQKSGGNTAGNVMFYVNCGIYVEELARIQAKPILAAPQEVDCHFRARMEEIAADVPDRFAITADTNMDNLRATLLSGLEAVIRFFETITSARHIVDYYTAGPFLHLGEESFHLLLQSEDIAAATQYLKALREKHGTEARWSIFANKYRAIFDQYGVDFDKL